MDAQPGPSGLNLPGATGPLLRRTASPWEQLPGAEVRERLGTYVHVHEMYTCMLQYQCCDSVYQCVKLHMCVLFTSLPMVR